MTGQQTVEAAKVAKQDEGRPELWIVELPLLVLDASGKPCHISKVVDKGDPEQDRAFVTELEAWVLTRQFVLAPE